MSWIRCSRQRKEEIKDVSSCVIKCLSGSNHREKESYGTGEPAFLCATPPSGFSTRSIKEFEATGTCSTFGYFALDKEVFPFGICWRFVMKYHPHVGYHSQEKNRGRAGSKKTASD